MAGDSDVEPSSYLFLIALGETYLHRVMQSRRFARFTQLGLADLPVYVPPVGIFFAAGVVYVVSIPVRAIWKALPQKKHDKQPKKQAPLPEKSSR